MNYKKIIKDLKEFNSQLKGQYRDEQNRNYCLQCKIDKSEKEKQELIDYLKEKIKEYTPNLRVNRCDEQGNIVAQYINPEVFIKQPVEVYKEILNKIEKR